MVESGPATLLVLQGIAEYDYIRLL
jgi:hypothetical protein